MQANGSGRPLTGRRPQPRSRLILRQSGRSDPGLVFEEDRVGLACDPPFTIRIIGDELVRRAIAPRSQSTCPSMANSNEGYSRGNSGF